MRAAFYFLVVLLVMAAYVALRERRPVLAEDQGIHENGATGIPGSGQSNAGTPNNIKARKKGDRSIPAETMLRDGTVRTDAQGVADPFNGSGDLFAYASDDGTGHPGKGRGKGLKDR